MVSMRRASLAVMLATSVVACGLTLSRSAGAFFIRQSAVACVPLADSPAGNSTVKASPIHPDGYVLVSTAVTNIYCSYPETDSAQKFNLAQVNVHAKGGSTARMETQACVSFWNGSGGSCGSITASQGFNLDQALGRPSAWASNDGHFAFLRIGNQGSVGASGTVIVKGMFYSN